MSSAIFWALVAGFLALRLSPLWGIIAGVLAAVLSLAVSGAAVAASVTVLFGAVGTDPGMARFARTVVIVIFGACVVGLIALVHMISTGSAPFSRGRASTARRGTWLTGRRLAP